MPVSFAVTTRWRKQRFHVDRIHAVHPGPSHNKESMRSHSSDVLEFRSTTIRQHVASHFTGNKHKQAYEWRHVQPWSALGLRHEKWLAALRHGYNLQIRFCCRLKTLSPMLKGIRAVMRDLHQIPFISLYKVCVVLSLITFSLPDYALLQRSAPRKLQPIFWNSQYGSSITFNI